MRLLVTTMAAVVGLAISTTQLKAEPEVVCAWCVEVTDGLGNTQHGFPNPTDPCTGSAPNWGSKSYCARCGGTSECHGFNEPVSDGECHRKCGPEGDDLAQRMTDLLDAGDLKALAMLMKETHTELELTFISAGGRIEVVANCNPSQVAAHIVVPKDVRETLQSLLS